MLLVFVKTCGRRHLQPTQPLLHLHHRSFVEVKVPWVRDRGLDHAVEKEKNLRPLIALKNIIKSEPSKSIPISIAAENKTQLCLPIRAIDFIRNYPSVFQEFIPSGGTPARPHVRLTPEVLHLDEEERFIHESSTNRQDAADRLLKLLMLARLNKLPLELVDRLRLDLGLPPDYVKTLLTDYPDYFHIVSIKTSHGSQPKLALELVCWSDELAVSSIEKKAKKGAESLYKKGMPLSFPLQFSRGFDLEKKVKKWVDDWQKSPYISPYENASHLDMKSDQAEKWVVALLHEVLHLLVSKKTDRDNILCLGEYLGLRSAFKRALINHPGIFYTSNKLRTHTVVLREAYKRDLLLEKHPLMGMRYRYIHLMNKLVEQAKPIGSANDSQEKKKKKKACAEGEDQKDDREEEMEDEDEDVNETEDEDEDEDEEEEDDDEEEEDDNNESDARHSVGVGRGMSKNSQKIIQASSNVRRPNMVNDRVPVDTSRGNNSRRGHGDTGEKSSGRSERSSHRSERYLGQMNPARTRGRSSTFDANERSPGRNERSLGLMNPMRTRGSPATADASERSPGRTERGRMSPMRTTGRLLTAKTYSY